MVCSDNEEVKRQYQIDNNCLEAAVRTQFEFEVHSQTFQRLKVGFSG